MREWGMEISNFLALWRYVQFPKVSPTKTHSSFCSTQILHLSFACTTENFLPSLSFLLQYLQEFLKSFSNPWFLGAWQKILLQQLLIHTSNLLGLGKNNLFGVKLRGFGRRVCSAKTRWNGSETIKCRKETIKSRKMFLMRMYKRERIHKSA
jgi:hypothetical protein